MLSSETKRKIDNARDILVGKIPVPSAQIELITIALIYKFMSDIDTQNKELGADGFFVGEYEKYAWSNIMDRKIGAHDRLYLYSEGLDKMGTNPHLPQMFRDIFRNAFLPFKDPQTLDRFLKQINEFSYDHSEELGNAFEYLLSTAGSQGDAGQFRTPRHIIDFIVQVVEPKHTDTILDPACGTAGFLISAYKYIMGQNQDKAPGDKLTLAQKNMLTKNFVGYDISHEMVRLSLVNMYLHNFGDPHIYEYDTLSSDERRDDRFDCILANPPFMTPKGGIQPHSRFSIKASKSEVLFVDYMMEHLNPHGKAGIIVPEGIIFQSATAYKSLRKKMIEENYLRAVVSLPSGVFQPYSGVKTSILLFDKELAKKSDDILFVKVNNDGYDLGAQRRATPDKDDLPKVLETIKNIKTKIYNEETIDFVDSNILSVPKAQIIDNGDYNLSVERYRVAELMNSDYPMVDINDLVFFQEGPGIRSNEYDYSDNGYPIINVRGVQDGFIDLSTCKKVKQEFINEKWNHFKVDVGDILFTTSGTIGRVAVVKDYDLPLLMNTSVVRFKTNSADLHERFLYWMLKSNNFVNGLKSQATGNTIQNVGPIHIKNMKIPLPPLEVQEQIVAELDGYQKIIDGAKQIVENYKPTIKIDPEWEMVELGEIADLQNGYAFKSDELLKNRKDGTYPVIKIGNILKNGTLDTEDIQYYPYTASLEKFEIKVGDILVAMTGATVGKVAISQQNKLYINQRCCILKNKERIIQDYLFIIMGDLFYSYCQRTAGGGAQGNISPNQILEFKIPLPPLEIQQQIVAEIEKEQAMVESAKELIEVFEGKVKEKIGEVWGE